MRAVRAKTDELELPLEMHNNPGTLSGVVTDQQGHPIPGGFRVGTLSVDRVLSPRSRAATVR